MANDYARGVACRAFCHACRAFLNAVKKTASVVDLKAPTSFRSFTLLTFTCQVKNYNIMEGPDSSKHSFQDVIGTLADMKGWDSSDLKKKTLLPSPDSNQFPQYAERTISAPIDQMNGE